MAGVASWESLLPFQIDIMGYRKCHFKFEDLTLLSCRPVLDFMKNNKWGTNSNENVADRAFEAIVDECSRVTAFLGAAKSLTTCQITRIVNVPYKMHCFPPAISAPNS